MELWVNFERAYEHVGDVGEESRKGKAKMVELEASKDTFLLHPLLANLMGIHHKTRDLASVIRGSHVNLAALAVPPSYLKGFIEPLASSTAKHEAAFEKTSMDGSQSFGDEVDAPPANRPKAVHRVSADETKGRWKVTVPEQTGCCPR